MSFSLNIPPDCAVKADETFIRETYKKLVDHFQNELNSSNLNTIGDFQYTYEKLKTELLYFNSYNRYIFYLFTKFNLMDSNLDDYYEQLWDQFTLPDTIYENIAQCVYDYYFNETPFNEKYLSIIVKHSIRLRSKVDEISKEYINDEKENYSSIFEFVDVYNSLHDRIEELYDLLLIDMDTILCYLNQIYFKEKLGFIKDNVMELVARDDIHYLKSFMLIIESHQTINKLFVDTYLEYHINELNKLTDIKEYNKFYYKHKKRYSSIFNNHEELIFPFEKNFQYKYNKLPKIEQALVSLLFNDYHPDLYQLICFIENKEILNILFNKTLLRQIIYEQYLDIVYLSSILSTFSFYNESGFRSHRYITDHAVSQELLREATDIELVPDTFNIYIGTKGLVPFKASNEYTPTKNKFIPKEFKKYFNQFSEYYTGMKYSKRTLELADGVCNVHIEYLSYTIICNLYTAYILLELNETDTINYIESLDIEFRKLTKLKLLRKKEDIYRLNPKFRFPKKIIDTTKIRIKT